MAVNQSQHQAHTNFIKGMASTLSSASSRAIKNIPVYEKRMRSLADYAVHNFHPMNDKGIIGDVSGVKAARAARKR